MKPRPTGIIDQHSLPGPENITQASLSNGISLLVRSNFNSPSVFIGGHLPCGALLDPAEKLGLADFTASALMRGAGKRSFTQIYDDLESNAASLSFRGGTHTAGFSGRALAEDLHLLYDLLSNSLFHPNFPSDEVERLRAQLLTGLAIRAQDTAGMASLTFDQILYDGHPYALPEDGWPETVQSITRDDLEGFHDRHYGPSGMVLAVVGAVEPKKVIELAEKILGGWKKPRQSGPPELPPFEPPRKTTRRKVSIPGKAQSDIAIGSSGPLRKSPEFMSASLGNSALGQFGLGGRIGETVRERSGLAYYAYSSLNAGVGPGAWVVNAGVNPKNIEKTIALVIEEIRRFVENGIRADELADSQSNYIGRLPLSLESNAGVVNALLNIERYDLGLDYYQRYPGLVQAVTPESVRETARRYLDPGKLAIAVAGS
jgi:zinc protease